MDGKNTPAARPKVFVSYAHEDREPFVRELVGALTQKGVDVWWDELELRPGDSLLSTIARALSQAQYGLVILSKNYFSRHKKWTHAELGGIFALDGERQRLVPVLYEMSFDELRNINPILADRVYIRATDLETAVNGILKAVAPRVLESSPFRISVALRPFAIVLLALIGLGLVGLAAIIGFATGSPYRLAAIYLSAGVLLSHVMHIFIYVNIDRRRAAISDTKMQAYYFWPIPWKLCLYMACILPALLLAALLSLRPAGIPYQVYCLIGGLCAYEVLSQAFGSSLIRLGFESGFAVAACALIASDAAVRAGASAWAVAAGLSAVGAVIFTLLALVSKRILHKYFESARFKQSEMVRFGLSVLYLVSAFVLSVLWIMAKGNVFFH